MLTLLLLRHAKAVQHAPGGDFARPLAPAGVEAARALGVRLNDLGLAPRLVLVSSSVRTLGTLDALSEGLRHQPPSETRDDLYDASAAQMRDLLRAVGPSVTTLMVLGHNPGIMDLAIAMARDGDPADVERMRHRFPPCSLAMLTFDTDDWLAARASGGRLDLYLTPEDVIAP